MTWHEEQVAAGKMFFREHYPWGRTVTYRLPDGRLEYHWGTGPDYRVVFGWQALKPLVLDGWVPVSQEDCRTYQQIAAGLWDI